METDEKKSTHTWEIHTTDEMKHYYSTLCGLNSTLTQSGPEIIAGEFKDAFKISGKDTSPDPNTDQSSDIKNLTKQTKNMLHAIYQGSSGCISEQRTHILKPIPKPVKGHCKLIVLRIQNIRKLMVCIFVWNFI